jgi:hypothetical protein
MRQNVPYENFPALVIYPRDQPVGVALDVEHRTSSNCVGCRKRFPHGDNISPLRRFRYPIPNIKGSRGIWMPQCSFYQLLSTDDAQVAAFSFEQFANCEVAS